MLDRISHYSEKVRSLGKVTSQSKETTPKLELDLAIASLTKTIEREIVATMQGTPTEEKMPSGLDGPEGMVANNRDFSNLKVQRADGRGRCTFGTAIYKGSEKVFLKTTELVNEESNNGIPEFIHEARMCVLANQASSHTVPFKKCYVYKEKRLYLGLDFIDCYFGALAFEFMPAGSLANVLEKKILPITTKLKIALDLTKGLLELHRGGIRHGDISAANVLLDNNFNAYFSDFEFADTRKYKHPQSNLLPRSKVCSEALTTGNEAEAFDIYRLGVVLLRLFQDKDLSDQPHLKQMIAFCCYKNPILEVEGLDHIQSSLVVEIVAEIECVLEQTKKSLGTQDMTKTPMASEPNFSTGREESAEDKKRIQTPFAATTSSSSSVFNPFNPFDPINVSPTLKEDQKEKQQQKSPFEMEVDFFAEAIEDNEEEAIRNIFRLGMQHEADDPATAAAYYQKAANKHHADALYRLSVLYEVGKGVPQDESKAFALCKLAADKEHIEALKRLADYYVDGVEGVQPPDPAEAVKCYMDLVEAEEYEAYMDLALCYLRGKGVTKDLEKAITYYEKAVENGILEAHLELANCYHYGGPDMRPDFKKANKHYTLAIAAGIEDAQKGFIELGKQFAPKQNSLN